MLDANLYLVGYRGSGKSSVARELASRLNCDFVDSDCWIENAAGKSIRQIFADDGEPKFRDLETVAMRTIAQMIPQVVSLGGGAVLRLENRGLLRSSGKCVWLQAAPEELARRIRGDATTMDRRPALTRLADYDEIVRLLAEREPLYREVANFTVQTDTIQPDNIAQRIVDWLAIEG